MHPNVSNNISKHFPFLFTFIRNRTVVVMGSTKAVVISGGIHMSLGSNFKFGFMPLTCR